MASFLRESILYCIARIEVWILLPAEVCACTKVAHTTRVYPSIKQLAKLLLPLGRSLIYPKNLPIFLGAVRCCKGTIHALPNNKTKWTQPGLKYALLNPEYNMLVFKPLCHLQIRLKPCHFLLGFLKGFYTNRLFSLTHSTTKPTWVPCTSKLK